MEEPIKQDELELKKKVFKPLRKERLNAKFEGKKTIDKDQEDFKEHCFKE